MKLHGFDFVQGFINPGATIPDRVSHLIDFQGGPLSVELETLPMGGGSAPTSPLINKDNPSWNHDWKETHLQWKPLRDLWEIVPGESSAVQTIEMLPLSNHEQVRLSANYLQRALEHLIDWATNQDFTYVLNGDFLVRLNQMLIDKLIAAKETVANGHAIKNNPVILKASTYARSASHSLPPDLMYSLRALADALELFATIHEYHSAPGQTDEIEFLLIDLAQKSARAVAKEVQYRDILFAPPEVYKGFMPYKDGNSGNSQKIYQGYEQIESYYQLQALKEMFGLQSWQLAALSLRHPMVLMVDDGDGGVEPYYSYGRICVWRELALSLEDNLTGDVHRIFSPGMLGAKATVIEFVDGRISRVVWNGLKIHG